ncbi:hypothetical protein THMIRHAS_12250 [Thiosulfatimonas sediminis]|uniref:Diguanylate cyclase n=1 Tax=Thiosulfatimonas sediminis TaxID=2675054 RepID=A0A6F8PUM9_9GAMM|nr:diguanylate cyclase [Thiosulfatimonas sediminis]BBP45852.1 hypothetical protein THMIRHAS_12250 [Thiosulfatimonas sediminis]
MATENEFYLVKAENSALLAELQFARSEIKYLNKRIAETEQNYLDERLVRASKVSFNDELFNSFFHQVNRPFLIIDRLGAVIERNPSADSFFDIRSNLNKMNQIHSLFDLNSKKQFSIYFYNVKQSGEQSEIGLANVDGKMFVLHIHPIDLPDYANHGLSELYAVIVVPFESSVNNFQMSELLVSAIDQLQQGVLIANEEDIIIRGNQGLSEITGYSSKEIIGEKTSILSSDRHPRDFYHSLKDSVNIKGYWEGEVWHKAKSGRVYLERLQVSRFFDELSHQHFYIHIFEDITLKKQEAEREEKRSVFDSVTNLPNERSFNCYLDNILYRASMSKQSFAVLSIEFDKLQNISNDFGLYYRDIVLQHAAQRIVSSVCYSDYVARIDVGTFMVVLSGLKLKSDLQLAVDKLCKQLQAPFIINDQSYSLVFSIGSGVFPDDGDRADALLQKTKA